ncbi:hypothetical protein [Agrococcus beijingensis]|uniref:hypothetical protein n=1 Tax=Agrococcus beijingensis TaxID=3068634 RepID=UPI00274050C0|nr:hypothetical protein [Agrococcus sp. REN33]
MTEAHGTDPDTAPGGELHGTDGLVDELDLLEQQPLEARAEQLARIHDRLQAELGAVRG